MDGASSPQIHHVQPAIGLLDSLLTLMVGGERTAELFDAFGISVITAVLDANVIIQDVSRYARTSSPTGLLIAARIGLVRFFCSTSVRDEVLEHLPRVAARHGATSDGAMTAWRQQYAPLITILDPAELVLLSAKAELVQHVDQDDVPTAQIIDAIRPHAVLSEDRHLAPYHPAGSEWTQWSAAYRNKSTSDATLIAIRLGGSVTIWGTLSSISAFVSLILKLDRRILIAIGSTLLTTAGVAITHPTSRQWLKNRLRATATWSSEYLAAPCTEILNYLIEVDREGKRASAFLTEKQLVHGQPHLARDYVLEVLSRSFAPLTTREIAQRMQSLGYQPRGEHPERYVSRVLRENPKLFARQRSRSWVLRSLGQLCLA